MKAIGIFFILILLSSCSSFEKMRYRHLQKVPATHQPFSESIPKCNSTQPAVGPVVVNESAPIVEQEQSVDTLQSLSEEIPASTALVQVGGDSLELKSAHADEIVPTLPVRKDRSLLMALLMIVAGIGLILLGLVSVPFFQTFLVIRILIGLLYLLAAWKLISYGMMILIARFRNNKTYKED